MKLLDVKAGLNPRSARIFLAKKGIDIPRVAIDMQAGANRMPKPDYPRWPSISATVMSCAMAIARRSVEPPAHLAEQDSTALPLSVDVRRKERWASVKNGMRPGHLLNSRACLSRMFQPLLPENPQVPTDAGV